MVESTLRAERREINSFMGPSYTWAVPQKPVAVRLPHEFINRLEQETVEAFRSLSSRGSEIGGVLLGDVTPGNPATVSVESYQLIECDYSRGPLFRLSDADTSRFARAIEEHSTGAGPRVVGYFRSHTRKGLALDAEDLTFFDEYLREPHHLVMLIRPFATKACSAGIFIRENGRIAAETSYLEFPFRVSELLQMRPNPVEPAPASAPNPAPPQAESAPPPPKASTRGQVVSIPLPRHEDVKESESAPPLAESLAAVKVQPSEDSERPAARGHAEPVNRDEKPEAMEKHAPSAPVTAPGPPTTTEDEVLEAEHGSNKKLRLLVAAAVAMVVLVGGGLFVAPVLFHRAARPGPAAQDSSPLQLRVDRTPGGLLLMWNRDAEAIRGATKVVLAIGDGDRHENIEMDPEQVRTGSILYPPISQDVSFRMEVTDAQHSKTASESLRVLDPRPSPLSVPDVAAAAAAPNGKPLPLSVTTEPSSETPGLTDDPTQQPATRSTPTRAFDQSSLASRLRAPAPADLPLPDAPTVTHSGVTTPTGLSAVLPGAVPAAPALPKSSETAKKSSSAAPTTGGQIVPAELTFRKPPEYPKMARVTGANGIVEIDAIIDADGRVRAPKVSKGNPMLQKAAIDAVLQWRYKPAMLNGKPVDSPVQIRLNFMPEK
jgi:TonB family protein